MKTTPTSVARRIHPLAWSFLLLALLMGCEERPTAPEPVADEEEEEIEIPLSRVLPEEAGQGETVHVQIFGSGFEVGDEVSWERDGAEAPGIVVLETLFVSTTRLIATLSVGAEATTGSYDVVVRGRHRRRGIGTEFFDILPGRGSEATAQFSFDYEGHRTGEFEVDNTFILEPDEMFAATGRWALTYFARTMQEQVIVAQQPRADGRVDFIACWSPGGKVREPSLRSVECWMDIGMDYETGEWEDSYTSWVGGDRPADGSGHITFTSVTPQRLTGDFSIEMHQEYDWDGEEETLLITDGTFDLPVLSAHWEEEGSGGEFDEGDVPQANHEAVLLPGPAIRANDISDRGFITGSSVSPLITGLPSLLWKADDEGNIASPSTLGALPPPFDDAAFTALRVNNSGLVVGIAWSFSSSGRPVTGFVYDGRAARLASTVGGTEYHTGGRDVNDRGQVAGWLSATSWAWAGPTPLFTRGAVWLDPLNEEVEPVLLEPLPGHDRSWASMINGRGHVVGMSWDSAGMEEVRNRHEEWGERSTVRWQIEEDGTLSAPVPIEVEGDHPFEGLLLTANGDMVGRLRTVDWVNDPMVVVRFGSDRAIVLGTVPGSDPRNRVNGASVSPEGVIRVVGTSRAAHSRTVPVLWEVGTDDSVIGPMELGPPPSRAFVEPLGINANGWIVGYGWEPGKQAPVMWRPVPGTAAASLEADGSERCPVQRDMRWIPRCRGGLRP